jgi:Putative porin
LQTGFNVYYFSAFQSREISPLHNEYKLQSSANAYSIGEVPNVDVFFNLKVKRMEIHLKIENLSSTFTSGYYTLPNVPYTDWRFRFGIKWYLFT